MTGIPDTDYLVASSPQSTDHQLFQVASKRPDLWPVILENPSVYPELADWIRQQQPAPAHRTQSRIPLIAALLLVPVLVVGGGVFWFLWGRTSESAGDPTAFGSVPQVLSVVSVAQFGEDLRLVPLGPNGERTATAGDIRITRLSGADGDHLVAVNTAERSQSPAWSAPIPAGAAGCELAGQTLDCAAAGSFNAKTGEPAVSASTDAASSDAASPDAQAPPADSVPAVSVSRQVTSSPSDEIPLATKDGNLLDSSGNVLIKDAYGSGPVWALPGAGPDWLVSDGSTVSAVDGKDILWEVDLPAGSASVNGFTEGDEPNWFASDGVLVVGTPSGVFGYDTADGSELWRVDTPTTSYGVDGDSLTLSTGDSVAVLEFPKRSAAQSGDAENVLMLHVPDAPEPAEPAAQVPTESEILNSTLKVPGMCAGYFDHELAQSPNWDSPTDVAFENGEYLLSEDEPKPDWISGVKMRDLHFHTLDEKLYVLAILDCFSGPRIQGSFLVLYDSDLNLIQDTDWQGQVSEDIAQKAYGARLDGITVEGETLIARSEGWLAPGEPDCNACTGSVTVLPSFVWNGSQYAPAGVEYEGIEAEPQTGVLEPDLDFLNHIYEQINNYNEDDVLHYFSGDALRGFEWIDTPWVPGGSTTTRSVHYTPGSGIAECIPYDPDDTEPYFPETDSVIDYFGPYNPGSPGDFLCAVRPSSSATEHLTGNGKFGIWWILSLDADGTPDIFFIGRNFS